MKQVRIKYVNGYNYGEIAAFSDEIADRLVRLNAAEYVTTETKTDQSTSAGAPKNRQASAPKQKSTRKTLEPEEDG